MKCLYRIISSSLIAVLFFGCIFYECFCYIYKHGEKTVENISKKVEKMQEQGESSGSCIVKAISMLDDSVNKNLDRKEWFIDINGLFQKSIGKDIIEDVDPTYTVYKMDNGQLTFTYPEMELDYARSQVKKLADFCKENQVELLYGVCPYKVDKYDSKLPEDYKDGSNINADKMISLLKKDGIETIDFRETFRDTEREYSSYFYNMDHHWRIDAAFIAYQEIIEKFKETYDYDYDVRMTDKNNFIEKERKKVFIGSQRKRVGAYYAGDADDFIYLYPKFDTSYVNERYNKNGKLRKDKTLKGPFEEAILISKKIPDEGETATGVEAAYLAHNPCVDVLTNENKKTGKVLILEDSFGAPVSSFMSLNFHETHVMDLRHYKGSVKEYIKENEIEYVVFLYSASSYKESTYSDLFRLD